MKSLLRATNLHFSYGSHDVLRGVELEIGAGENLLLLGENGAGKTTLLACVVGLIRPTSGVVSYGRPISIAGYVGDPAFVTERSGNFQLEADAQLRGRPFDGEHASVVARRLGIEPPMLRRTVGSYSAGMRKRLAILRALVSGAELLILDEPLSGLDPVGLRQVSSVFDYVRKEWGISFLISSHLIAEAQRFATRAVVLQNGTVADLMPVASGYLDGGRWRFETAEKLSDSDRCWISSRVDRMHQLGPRRWLVELPSSLGARRLLADMVARAIPITDFAREANDLEHVFLAQLKGTTDVAP